MLMMPTGFIALLAGWFVTEIGRQPYVAYGVLLTAQSASPAIIGAQVAWSLVSFVIIYTLVFGAGSYYILKLIAKGFSVGANKHDEDHHVGIEASVVESLKKRG
jgi:cytochrome d ubiquinol oxidase subunit I